MPSEIPVTVKHMYYFWRPLKNRDAQPTVVCALQTRGRHLLILRHMAHCTVMVLKFPSFPSEYVPCVIWDAPWRGCMWGWQIWHRTQGRAFTSAGDTWRPGKKQEIILNGTAWQSVGNRIRSQVCAFWVKVTISLLLSLFTTLQCL